MNETSKIINDAIKRYSQSITYGRTENGKKSNLKEFDKLRKSVHFKDFCIELILATQSNLEAKNG